MKEGVVKTLACVFLLLLAGAGCSSIGPGTIRRDRLHYSAALSDSWKEQLLVNIVKTRYGDAPAFLEVASVVSGYTLETGVGAMGQYSPPSLRGDTFVGGAVSAKFTDRPTISYVPLSGEKFARSLLSPVPLDAVWSLIQGGVPADFLLGLTLQSMAGHHNLGLYAGGYQHMEPEFARLLRLIRALQQDHTLSTEVVKEFDVIDIWLRFPPAGSTPADVKEETAELKALLNVPAETNRVRFTYGGATEPEGVVGVRTRSLMQIISTLGAGVEIPEELAAMGGFVQVDATQLPPGFRVRSGKEKPKDPFLTIPYDGYWYWVDRQDLPSKTTLAAVTVLLNFLEGGGTKATPVLTIPTN